MHNEMKNEKAHTPFNQVIQVKPQISINTSHIIKRTGKMIEINRNNAFSGLKFDTEGAKI